jgi:hypothetical protein
MIFSDLLYTLIEVLFSGADLGLEVVVHPGTGLTLNAVQLEITIQIEESRNLNVVAHDMNVHEEVGGGEHGPEHKDRQADLVAPA